MAKLELNIHLSYSQLCIYIPHLPAPLNDWSEKNLAQGYSWRPCSSSFRTLVDDGPHKINVFINEPYPPLTPQVVRHFKVHFETMDGLVSIASITDAIPIEVPAGSYLLQVEFLAPEQQAVPEVNVRFNKHQQEEKLPIN